MYLILPETEGRTLEDIEVHFSDNHKRITDRHIVKHSTMKYSKGEEAAASSMATVPTKVISTIGDIIEMKNAVLNGNDAMVNGINEASKKGCDNYAFAMDR